MSLLQRQTFLIFLLNMQKKKLLYLHVELMKLKSVTLRFQDQWERDI